MGGLQHWHDLCLRYQEHTLESFERLEGARKAHSWNSGGQNKYLEARSVPSGFARHRLNVADMGWHVEERLAW